MVKLAVLDDYQKVAERMADWNRLPEGVELQIFTDHLTEESKLVARLKDFQIIMGMRERTPFPRSLLAQLPELQSSSAQHRAAPTISLPGRWATI